VKPLLTAFVLFPLFSYRGMAPLGSPLPDPSTIAVQLVAIMMMDDTWFYWAHRLAHHRSIYAAVHKQHHKFKIPLALGTE
jgi:sterol desaturase/sphingolipid hydroxylase (fatty acid hydroxylase superfamily)